MYDALLKCVDEQGLEVLRDKDGFPTSLRFKPRSFDASALDPEG